MNSRTRDCQIGFTLVEIAVAVALLGIAFTTLVSLHTRMLDTYFTERNRTRASLAAQYLMTLIEIAPEPPQPGTKEQPLEDALKEAGYYDASEDIEKDSRFDGWTYYLDVTSIDLPNLADDALRRIDVRISWGEGDDREFSLVFFVSPFDSAQTPTNPFGGLGSPS